MTITNRELTAGTRLTARHKGTTYKAEVAHSDEGLRITLEDGREFTSLSSAGKAVMGGVSCNGWRFWSIDGEEQPTPKQRTKRQASTAMFQRMKDQAGASDGAVRFYCSGCQDAFEMPRGKTPTACPKGHSGDE